VVVFTEQSGHLRAFHRNTALLFQFIFAEFLMAQRELLSLLNLIHCAKEKISLDIASAALTKLVGSVNEQMRLFLWSNQDGILTKLKNNCGYFIQNSSILESSLLHTYADQAWLLTAKCLNGMRQHQIIEAPLLQQAVDDLFSLGDVLNRIIAHFKDDENVIFFILRHKEPLDALYKEPFVRNYFEKIYPEGLRSVSQLLTARYKARGFGHLIPIIEKLCHTPTN
jgi:hypothetical protein